MRLSRMTRRAAIAATGVLALCAGVVHAQTYPERPIRIVVGFSAGGSVDGAARIAAQILSEGLRTPVVVENLTGASGAIAAGHVAAAAPDGHTLFVSAPANVINPIINKQVAYNLASSFEAIGMIADVPNVLVVHPSVPVATVQELVAYARQRPGALSYGSAGVGSVSHLAGALFAARGGLDMVHVPYKGTAAAQTDLLGGRVPVMFDSMVSALPNTRTGKLRALAVTSPQRWPSAQDLPTVAESGFPGFSVSTWIGLHAPAGTPAPVIDRLSDVLMKGLQTQASRDRLASLGAEPGQHSSREFSAFVQGTVDHWRKAIESGEIRVSE